MQAQIRVIDVEAGGGDPFFEDRIPMGIELDLNPDFIKSLAPDKEVPESIFVHVFIDSEVSIVSARDLNDVFVQPFSNAQIRLSHAHAVNVERGIHMNECTILHADFVDSEVMLVYCDVRRLQFRSNAKESKIRRRLVIHESTITHLQVSRDVDWLNLQGAHIHRAMIWCKKVAALHIWQHSQINNLIVTQATIDKFQVKDGVIKRLEFAPEAKVEQLELQSPKIETCIGILPCSFSELTLQAANLWRMSAVSRADRNETADANYHYMDLWVGTLKSRTKRVMYRIFGLICGYGQKPSRANTSSAFVIILFGLLFTIASLFSQNQPPNSEWNQWIGSLSEISQTVEMRWWKAVLESFYFSVVTFATLGYGDIAPTGLLVRAAAVVEALIGVAMMGIFVSSLIIRYGRT